MKIVRINYVLERAIASFQSGEIEALWEYTVPTPAQMQKMAGMSVDIGADDALRAVDSALSVLRSAHGKLTDPGRTPDNKEVAAALNDFIEIAKRMRPKDRKEALARLRDWQKTARAHAKRLQGAVYSYGTRDVGRDSLQPARNVRDSITTAIGIVSKYRGGGFGKSAEKKPTERKKGEKKQSPYQKTSAMKALLGMSPEERKAQMAAMSKKWAGKYVAGDATVQTFLRILEAALWKASRDGASGIRPVDFNDEIKTLNTKFKSKMGSDDKGTLKSLSKAVEDAFVVYKDYGIDQLVKDWLIDQVRTYIRSDKFPYAPGGTQVRPFVSKRQVAMKFEALRRMKLALVG